MTKIIIGKDISYDPDEKGYIMFDLTNHITEQVSQIIDEEKLLPKGEYHSSLLSVERYTDNKDTGLKIALSIKHYLETHDLAFVKLGHERYVCKKDGRMTLVAPVIINGIDELRAHISSLIPEYDPPFSHVTLLKSSSTEFGIGINSMAELDQYCTLLPQ